MTERTTPAPRVWPAVAMLAAYWAVYYGSLTLELATPVRFFSRLGAAALLVVLVNVWWWAFSRLPRADKWLGFAAVLGGAVAAAATCHPSINPFGLFLMALGPAVTAGVLWLLVAGRSADAPRRAGLVAAVLLTWAYFPLVRVDGLSGTQVSDVRWRWEPTHEEIFLAERAAAPAAAEKPAAAEVVVGPGDWPGFRGPDRDGVAAGVTPPDGWAASKPAPRWRKRLGPAWSSFAVAGELLVTQEQRGDKEAVVAYDAATGSERWAHAEEARFYESITGPGPRATPTIAGGRVYAFGGTGRLVCLDAATGSRRWVRDVPADAPAPVPMWGFSASPLVADGVVIVTATGEKAVRAYDAETGEPRWSALAGNDGYSSPQPATVAGRRQVLAFHDRGVAGFDPATGTRLGGYDAANLGKSCWIQPHAPGGGRLLVGSEGDLGLLMVNVSGPGDAWSAGETAWQAKTFKPSFNDLVVRGGHAYAFDAGILCCVDLATGKRCWKDGRYGHGQLLLLADPGLLLVVTEKGEVAVVAAEPGGHRELGKFPAVTGKTWNHPAVAGGRLFVRNAEEMACFDLSP